MTIKNLKERLDQDSYYHHCRFDELNERAIKCDNKHSGYYENLQQETQKEANIVCYIVELLADINNSSEDSEFDRLYKKFNIKEEA